MSLGQMACPIVAGEKVIAIGIDDLSTFAVSWEMRQVHS